MELKATSLLLLACVALIILTGAEGAIPRCCVTVSKRIPRYMLKSASKYEIQSRSGVCDIDALILYVGEKRICASPKVRKLLKKMRLKRHW